MASTRAADDATLTAGVNRLAEELLRAGVTTFESKSGYGLTVEDEARSLAVARRFTSETTFLGAHVVPAEFRDNREGYIDLVTGPMLDACVPFARWIDVFCDRGAFDVDESRAILAAGVAAGLQPRVHAGQLGTQRRDSNGGGTRGRVGGSLHLRLRRGHRRVGRRLHSRNASARGRVLHPCAMAGRPSDDRRRRHSRDRDRLQPWQFVHHEHAVLHRRSCQGHEVHSGGGLVVGDRRWCRRASTRRRGCACSGQASRLSYASTRPRMSIWLIGPACRWCATSWSAAS